METFIILALSGEVGELANIRKKELRSVEVYKRHDKLMELADIMIYLYMLAEYYGVDLDKICSEKCLELRERWPEIWEPSLTHHDSV